MNPPFFSKSLVNPLPPKIHRPDHVPDLWRLKGLYLAVLVMMAIIIARLWWLQIAMGTTYAEDAERQRTRPVRRIAPRGEILDVKGRRLATSSAQYVVTLLPEEIAKNPQALPILAGILNCSVQDLQQKLADNDGNGQKGRKDKLDARLLPRQRKPVKSVDPVKVAEKVDIQVITQIEEQKLDLDGVQVTRDPVRVYKDERLCTHLLGIARPIPKGKLEDYRASGYHDDDLVGESGLERVYEDDLRGQDGSYLVAVDAHNRMLRRLGETDPTPGRSLKLNIDLDLQRTAYNALRTTLAEGHPGSAAAIDPDTGAVLAMVSLPSYDLNEYRSKYGDFLKDKNKPLLNRAVSSVYACGSTFKLITAAAGLETGAITTGSYINCPGYLYVGKKRFGCDGVHGSIGLETALAKSCDVFFYETGAAVGASQMEEWSKRFGLGERTGVDIPGEHKGVVPSPAWKKARHLGHWVPGDLTNMSIGQGFVGVTPIQLADYTAALANGGTLWKPTLVREVRNASGKVIRSMVPEARGNLTMHPRNLTAIVRGMQMAMEKGGTAEGIAIPGLAIAGKTGTAQTSGGDNSVFVCFAPVDHPKIAICVLIEKVGHGASYAAPVANKMLRQYFNMNTVALAAADTPRRRR